MADSLSFHFQLISADFENWEGDPRFAKTRLAERVGERKEWLAFGGCNCLEMGYASRLINLADLTIFRFSSDPFPRSSSSS